MTESEKAYYEKRAPEYDDWYLGTGLLQLGLFVAVACGTGFQTQHLPGQVVALDQSLAMLKMARQRLEGPVAQGDAFQLPFRDRTADCLLAGHFYGHLTEE